MATKKKKDYFIDIWQYHNPDYPFNIFIGGRGTGKTYSGLGGAVDNGQEFIYMRRLQSELDLQCDTDREEGINPFGFLNEDKGWDIGLRSITAKSAGIYHRGWEGEKRTYGDLIGYGLALSTLAKLRGIALTKVAYWLYDEFIKERHVARLPGEGDAFFNAYDTINRNRELLGMDPIIMDLCSNATDIYNDIFVTLNIVLDVEKMIASGKSDLWLYDRGLGIHLLESSEKFKEDRRKSAIGKLSRGTRYEASAIDNVFSYNDFSLICHQDLKGWRPQVSFESQIFNCSGTIFVKKGERRIHVSYASASCENYKIDRMNDYKAFQRRIGIALQNPYLNGYLTFESYQLKQIILDMIL